MEITEIITWTVGTLMGLGALFAGLGVGYGQFKKGTKSVDDDTIASLQRQITAQAGEIKGLGTELSEVRKENKELVGLNNQLQGQLKTYKEMISLQDPNFRESFRKIAEAQECMQKELKEHYDDDTKNFKEITSRLDKGVKRGKLNTAHITALEQV